MNKTKSRLITSLVVLFLIISLCGGLLLFKFEETWARFISLIGAYAASGLSVSISSIITSYKISNEIASISKSETTFSYGSISHCGSVNNYIIQAPQNENFAKNGIPLDLKDKK